MPEQVEVVNAIANGRTFPLHVSLFPQRWEYETVKAENLTENKLESLGRNGWELVLQGKDNDGVLSFYFKRPRI